MSTNAPVDPRAFVDAQALLAAHLTESVASQEWVQAVEHDAEIDRWYVRFGSEVRDAATIYFDLHQRSLHYEIYFLPAPEAGGQRRREDLFELLLRANHDLYSASFAIGPDGDCYLRGRVLFEHLDVEELDRILGVLYAAVERWFPLAVSIAFPR